MSKELQKEKRMRSRALLDSAHGEDCTIGSPFCNHNPETTVAAHMPDGSGTGKVGGKSDDWCIAFACSDCHTFIDSYVGGGEREFYIRRGLVRTWRRLIEMGIIKIGGGNRVR